MSQLLTLFWLKWKLLRNSLRSSKAVVNQMASVFGTALTLGLALSVAIGLGVAAYFINTPGTMSEAFRRGAAREGFGNASAEFIFFSIFAFLYLMWATVPLSIGSGKQFDPGKMLMYPISLGKLFAIDFLSELSSIQCVFGIPAIFAMCLGAGLGSGNLAHTLIVALPAMLVGMGLSKWLSTSIGSLVRRRRARGETIIALVGGVAALGGALAGQIAPLLFRHADSVRFLRWTPPGAAAYLLISGNDPLGYLFFLTLLCGYGVLLVFATYWVARRSALGLGGERRRKATAEAIVTPAYTGWQLPLISAQLSAVIEKELRYAMRNAQLRMMAMMPLILIVVRFMNSRRLNSSGMRSGASQTARGLLAHGSAWMATGGVLYVFLLLAGLSCNLFAFEEGGMRTLVLSPIERWKILLGKNIAVTIIAALFSTVLLAINAVVFRDFTAQSFLFVVLSFAAFASLMALIGNWFSIRFPKRMPFGKRLNVSGVAGLLLIPMILLLSIPPLAATLAGYFLESSLIEFVVLAVFAIASILLYFLVIDFQGRSLERREIEILEVVKEPNE